MKFSKDLFNNHRDKLKILLETYFETGGTQAMLNVVGREDLENALKYPEKYQNLIVPPELQLVLDHPKLGGGKDLITF